jgi:nitroreductase
VELLEGLATTRAIRRYRPDPIPDHDLATMLWHATRAPTGSNRQSYRFVVLRDTDRARAAKALLGEAFRASWAEKRREAGFDQGSGREPTSPKARAGATMQHYVDHFEDIPVVILPCLIRYRAANPYEGASIYPSCQNLLLAARALGYGGVLTMWHQGVEAELRSVLGVPDDAAISATITLGVPEGRHGPVRRKPLAEVVTEGYWDGAAPWAVEPAVEL